MSCEIISGTITRITFRAEDTGWAVFKLDNTHAITGTLPQTCGVGTEVKCTGKYTTGKFGKQLNADIIEPAPIDTSSIKGITALLTRLPGIGEVKAQQIVDEFGPALAWDTAKNNPEKLPVGARYHAIIAKEANNLDGSHEALQYFYSVGMTTNQASKVLDKIKNPKDAVLTVKNNPYSLTRDIKGFGFLIVDAIALNTGVRPGNPERIKEAILFCLDDSELNNGNIWSYGGALMDIAGKLLASNITKLRLPFSTGQLPTPTEIRQAIYDLATQGRVKIHGKKVFSKSLLEAEKEIEEALQWT